MVARTFQSSLSAGIFLVLLTSGCMTMPAEVTVFKPGAGGLDDIRTVEVRPFTVGEQVDKDAGESVRNALRNALKERGFDILDCDSQTEDRRTENDKEGRKQAAAHAPIDADHPAPDAVIKGHVTFYKCDEIAAPKNKNRSSVAVDVSADPVTATLHALRFAKDDEFAWVEVLVAFRYDVVDKHGRVRISDKTSLEAERIPILRSAPLAGQKERVLQKLLETRAQEVVCNLKSSHPERGPLVFVRGNGLINEGNAAAVANKWEEARRAWEQALEESPRSDAAEYNLGLYHERILQYEKALKHLDKAVELRGESWRFTAVDCFAEKGLYEGVRRRVREEKFKQDVKDTDLVQGGPEVNRGYDMAKYADWDGAIQVWRQAVEEDAKDHAAWYDLGCAYMVRADFTKARQALDHAVALRDDKLYQQALERLRRKTVAVEEPAAAPPPAAE